MLYNAPLNNSFRSRVEIAKSIIYLPKYNLLALLNTQGIRVNNTSEIEEVRNAWLQWLDDCAYSTFLSYHDAFNEFVKHLNR